jgi:hypothetical protein
VFGYITAIYILKTIAIMLFLIYPNIPIYVRQPCENSGLRTFEHELKKKLVTC